MKKLINSIINKYQTGLCLIDQPTGFGKSRSIAEVLAEHLKSNSNKTMFYITPNRNNRNDEEEAIKKILQEDKNIDNKEALAKMRSFLSNEDSMILHLDSIEFPSEITDLKQFKNLQGIFEIYRNAKKNENVRIALVDSEKEFRKAIKKEIRKDYGKQPNPNEVLNSEKYSWIKEMYPASCLNNYKVIITTVSKFINKVDPIVGSTYFLWDKYKNNICFIDEFDSSKTYVLKKIVEERTSLQNGIDVISTFNDIINYANSDIELQDALITPAKSEENKNFYSLSNIKEETLKYAKAIFDKYNLKHNFKYEGNDDRYIFHTKEFNAIADEKMFVHCNKTRSINEINENGNTNSIKLSYIINDINIFIQNFAKAAVHRLAINYVNRRMEEGVDVEMIDAIRSILNGMRISETTSNILCDLILNGNIEHSELRENDDSVYMNGIDLYRLENSDSYAEGSKISNYKYTDSPESIMLKICSNMLVIGSSATATNETVIGNYDLQYLKSKLTNNYIEIPSEEKKRISNDYENHISGYNEVEINIKEIESIEKIDDLKNDIKNGKRQLSCTSDTEDEDWLDELKVIKNNNIKHLMFILDTINNSGNAKTILCMMNSYANLDNKDSNERKFLERYLDIEYKDHQGYDYNLFVLKSDHFEDEKEMMQQVASENKLVLVITTYQATMTGQNLDYPIDEKTKESLIKTNNKDWGKDSKDFDCIALEKPTYIIPNLNSQGRFNQKEIAEGIIKYSAMYEIGELSIKEFYSSCASLLNKGKSDDIVIAKYDLYRKPSVIKAITKEVEQAIGRINRTSLKSKNIYVIIENSLRDSIDTSLLDTKDLITPEFKELLKYVKDKNTNELKPNTDKLTNNANRLSRRFRDKIESILENSVEEWGEENMVKWEEMREFALKYPFANDCVDDKYHMLIELPTINDTYSYDMKNDFKDISIKFDGTGKRIVSADSDRLNVFMQLEDIKQLFKEKEYPIVFESCKYMLNPVAFNNIRKGALGEIIGKHIFDKFKILKLQSIDNPILYEKFDFVTDNNIYIDFKNWAINCEPEEKNKEISHVIEKARKCDAKKVLIINMIDDGTHKIGTDSINDCIIYTIPGLITSNNNGVVYSFETINKIKEILNDKNNN